jgi:DNA-binding NarL/FixJ family response regulator
MKYQVGDIFTAAEWKELAGQLGLSSQQAQITHHLFEGLGDKQIASAMGISEHTVRTYLSRMFAKLGVQDRNELLVGVFRRFRAGCDSVECPR